MSKFQKMLLDVEDYDDVVERAKTEQIILETPTRAIIDGLLYDTSKSKMIMKFRNSLYCNSYLYMTSKGHFFIRNGSSIKPITECDAKETLSYYPDKYQEIFGKVEDA